jgi:hypothetical protein
MAATATSNGIPFHFDEQRHLYVDLERNMPLLSATQILTSLNYTNYADLENLIPEELEHKRKLGKLVHQMCHFDDEADFEDSRYLEWPQLLRRLNAYRKFKKDTGYKALFNEGRQIGEVMGMRYGMTFDSIGQFHGRAPHVIVDIKNAAGQPQRAWGLQLTGYAMGQKVLPTVPARAFVRIALQLFDDETYRVLSSNDPGSKIFKQEDFSVWPACLAVAIDQRNCGVTK